MHVGCTATRYGATDAQLTMCTQLLFDVIGDALAVAHHGMCIGGDAQFHAICRAFGPRVRIVGHPGISSDGSADHRADVECDEVREPLPHMKRNATIVSEVASGPPDGVMPGIVLPPGCATGVMIAMPFESDPQPRGGTWATTFMALRKWRANRLAALHVIAPNGELLDHSGWRLR